MKPVCSRLLVRQKDGQNGFLDVEAVLGFGEDLVGDSECGRVFRMKGFMRVDSDSEDGSGLSAWAECDRRQWIELNATKNEITIRPLHVGQEVLIVIGEELHEEKIKSYLKI